MILQSDNGREFVNQIINDLKCMWNNLKIVHGKPRHSQSQGSVERANQDIQNILTTWMQTNNSTSWSEGLRFVQLMKNRAFHSGIKRSPYQAMFGSSIKIGLSTSILAPETINNISSEEDLENLLQNFGGKSEERNSADANQDFEALRDYIFISKMWESRSQEDLTTNSNLFQNSYRFIISIGSGYCTYGCTADGICSNFTNFHR